MVMESYRKIYGSHFRKWTQKIRKEVIAMKDKRDLTRVPFAGVGLVFGTAIGSVLSIAITGNVLWGGIGTGIGLVAGSVIDAFIKKRQ